MGVWLGKAERAGGDARACVCAHALAEMAQTDGAVCVQALAAKAQADRVQEARHGTRYLPMAAVGWGK